MNEKGKAIGIVLVITVILGLSILTSVLYGNYPIEEAEGKATAEAFLSALQAGDHDAMAALYHPKQEMDAEKMRQELEPDEVIRYFDLNKSEITDVEIGNFISNTRNNNIRNNHSRSNRYGVIFTMKVNDIPCTGVLYLKKDIHGYGINYFVIVPYGN
ncbi:MAG: hypothetical protein IJY39_09900 [Clostridia bacterium]|nr:hypothetical protein [Clostridia bacterium]